MSLGIDMYKKKSMSPEQTLIAQNGKKQEKSEKGGL